MKFGAGNDWLTGAPAAIRRKLGKGTITYLGSVLDSKLMDRVARSWIADAGISSPAIAAPAGVKVSRRVGSGREVYVVTNFSKEPQEIALPKAMTAGLERNQ